MNTSGIEALNELLNAFDKKNFDLDSWKIKAIVVLKNIFGENDSKVSFIEELQYSYSSWALRDNMGGKQNDIVKEKAKELISAAILELSFSSVKPRLASIFQNALSPDEYISLVKYSENSELKEANLIELFSKIAPFKKDKLLAQLVLLLGLE